MPADTQHIPKLHTLLRIVGTMGITTTATTINPSTGPSMRLIPRSTMWLLPPWTTNQVLSARNSVFSSQSRVRMSGGATLSLEQHRHCQSRARKMRIVRDISFKKMPWSGHQSAPRPFS